MNQLSELDLVLVSEGGGVFRLQQAASEVAGAGKQGGYCGLWRQTGTDQAAGLHAVFEYMHRWGYISGWQSERWAATEKMARLPVLTLLEEAAWCSTGPRVFTDVEPLGHASWHVSGSRTACLPCDAKDNSTPAV